MRVVSASTVATRLGLLQFASNEQPAQLAMEAEHSVAARLFPGVMSAHAET